MLPHGHAQTKMKHYKNKKSIDICQIIHHHQFNRIQTFIHLRLSLLSKQGTVDMEKCDRTQFYKSGSIKIKKLQGTIKNAKLKDFSDELIDRLHSVFTPCNERLFQLLELHPQLALKEFVWSHWHFTPSAS